MPFTASHLRLLIALLLGLAVCRGSAAEPGPALTSAQQILALSEAEAGSNRPVRLEGIVTVCDPFWSGEFFLQDETGGVFIDNKMAPMRPSPGDVMEVTGVCEPGAFAPIVAKPKWRLLRKAALPPPKSVTIDQLMTGAEDGQRVEVSGWVRAFGNDQGRLRLEIVAGTDRLHVFLPREAGIDGAGYVGCKVRVRGVTSVAPLNFSTRRLVTVKIWVALPRDVELLTAAWPDPFLNPPTAIGTLAHYSLENNQGRRSHVRALVTYRNGNLLYVSDSTGGLEIRATPAPTVQPGDTVDVIGFPTLDRGLLVLADAVVRKTGKTGRLKPHALRTMQDLRNGLFHADYISVQGRLLNFIQRPLGTSEARQVTIVFETAENVFTAEAIESGPVDTTTRMEIGSIVEVSGVCATTVDQKGEFESCRLLLPSLANLRIVKHASPFTIARLLVALLIVLAVSLAIAVWSVVLSRRNASLSVEVRERKAILAERSRLAHDLHDTLEQVLTGISLQLQAAQRLAATAPERAQVHLAAASEGVRQSHSELRRSIWNLASEALERLPLFEALERTGRAIADASALDFDCTLEGGLRPLDPAVEENLLRIAQEAATNAVKHAHATRIELRLAFAPAVTVLEIRDNGRGFEDKVRTPDRFGGFGLSSMRERAGRIGGSLCIESAPSQGTTVRVEIPLFPNASPARAGTNAPSSES